MSEETNQGEKTHSRVRTAAQTAFLMALLTLGSKVLGFAREVVMANYFGTSYIVDAYVMALAIPGLLFMGFFGALDTAYMPLFSEIREKEGERLANKFTSEAMNIALILSLSTAMVGLCFTEQFVAIFASGFIGEKAMLTRNYLQITFLYAIFTSLTGIIESQLRYKGIFLLPILIGYLQNAVVILVYFMSVQSDYHYLVWGWFAAYALRFAIILPISKKNGFDYIPSLQLTNSGKKIIMLSMPVLIGSYVTQINSFVDKTLASRLPEGSVSALNYGYLLIGIITSLTISIFITIIYPKMNQAQSLSNNLYFNQIVRSGFTIILMIAIPLSLGAMTFSPEIVKIIYQRGAFDSAAATMTSIAFFFYSIGILFISLNSFIVQIFYSLHDMKTPLLYGAVSVAINIVLNIWLVQYMALGGLALASSLAQTCNVLLLYVIMRKKYPHVTMIVSGRKILVIIGASIVAIAGSWVSHLLFIKCIIPSQLPAMLFTVVVAAIIYILLLFVAKVEELSILKTIINH